METRTGGSWTRLEALLAVIAGVLILAVAVLAFMAFGGGPTAETPSQPAAPTPTADTATGSWDAFRTRVNTAAGQQKVILTELGAWLPNVLNSTLAAEKAAEYQDKLHAWAAGELAWLAENPPDDCYQGAFTAWKAFLDDTKSVTVFGGGFATNLELQGAAVSAVSAVGCT